MVKVIKLDYTLESPEERKALVEKIIEETPDITPGYLDVLANYLVVPMEKQERKQKRILTDNRMATVNKRECSFESLVSQLENGEDGIYNLIKENKNMIFQPKISITQHDLDTIPYLRQLRESIALWEDALKRASGKDAFVIKKALIEMRKEQYIIKQAYQRPMIPGKLTRSVGSYPSLDDDSELVKTSGSYPELKISGISLLDGAVVGAILCNYSKLKEDSYGHFNGDMWYLIQSFEDICDKALEEYPIYKRILEMKIDKIQNVDIRRKLKEEFGETYTVEYISNLWRNKIPGLIAIKAQEELIIHEYKRKKYPMKKCTKCGQIKPAHNRFFSKNSTSSDGLYSICKKCRNKKKGV